MSEPKPKPKSRLRRISRWTLRIFAGLIAVIVALVAAVLWLPAASQLAVRVAMQRWDAAVPGQVEWAGMSGSLASGLSVDALAIDDGEGRALVHAQRLALRLDTGALVGGALSLDVSELRGLEVHLDHDWSALSSPSPEPQPPAEGYGPNLPVQVRASLALREASIIQAGEALLTLDGLDLGASGIGRSAEASLSLWGAQLPAQGLRVDSLELGARWDAPMAEVIRLELVSPLARAALIAPANYDVDAATGELALSLRTEPQVIAEQFAIAPLERFEVLDLELHALGGPAALSVGVDLDADDPSVPGLASLFLDADLDQRDAGGRVLDLALEGDIPAGLVHAEQGALHLELGALAAIGGADERQPSVDDAFADADAELVRATAGATTDADASEEASASGGASLDLTFELRDLDAGDHLVLDAGAAAPELGAVGDAWLEFTGPGLALAAQVEHDPAGSLAALLSADARDLGELGAPLARYLDIPELARLSGSGEILARCGLPNAASSDALSCVASTRFDDAAGYGTRLRGLDAQLRSRPLAPDPTVDGSLAARGLSRGELALSSLDLDLSGDASDLSIRLRGAGTQESIALDARLRREDDALSVALAQLDAALFRGKLALSTLGPARVRVGGDRLAVDGLRVRVAKGELSVDGDLALSDDAPPGRLDLRVDEISLSTLAPLVPGLDMAGEVSIDGQLRGSVTQPSGELRLHAEALRLAELDLGEVELAAALGRGAAVGASIPGTDAIRRVLDPLTLYEDQPPSPADIEVPETAETPADPLALEALAANERTERLERDRGLRLRLWTRVAGPTLPRAELSAQLPLDLGAKAGLSARRPLAARLVVEDFDLAKLAPYMPEAPQGWQRELPSDKDKDKDKDKTDPEQPPAKLEPAGSVAIDLEVGGSLRDPSATVDLLAEALAIDGAALGELRVGVHVDSEDAALELRHDLPVDDTRTRTTVHARAPLLVDLVHQRARWTPEAPHSLALDIDNLDLEALERSFGPRLPALAQALEQADVQGGLGLSVRAQGGLDDPELHLQLLGRELVHAGQALGELELLVDQAMAQTELTVFVDGPLAQRLDARALLPMSVAPLASSPLRVDTHAPLSVEAHVVSKALSELLAPVTATGVDGRVRVDLELGGSLAEPTAELAASLRDASLEERASFGDLGLVATLAANSDDVQRVQVRADLGRRGAQLATIAATLPVRVSVEDIAAPELAWLDDGHHTLQGAGRGLDLEILDALAGVQLDSTTNYLDPDVEPELEIGFELAGAGTLTDFSLDTDVHGEYREGEHSLHFDTSVDADEARQAVAIALRPDSCDHLEGELTLELPVPALVRGEFQIGETPFALSLEAPGYELDTLSPLVPASLHDLRGTLLASVAGEGTLTEPHLDGQVELRKGAVTVLDLRQRIEGIAFELAFDDGDIRLPKLAAKAGRGGIDGHGEASVRRGQGIEGQLSLQLDDFPLIRPGLPTMAIDLGAEIGLDLDPETFVVDVVLDEPTIEVARLGGGAPDDVPQSEDVVFASEIAALEPGEEIEIIDPDASPELNIRVRLADPLLITGSAVDMTWTGAVEVDRRGPGVSVDGQLQAKRGWLNLLGGEFEIVEGTVTMPADGTLDPYVNLRATTNTSEATVTVNVDGRISAPSIRFSSEPPLDEYQIVTLLVTGSSDLNDASDASVESQVSSLLAAASNPALQRQLSQRLGIDRARIGFGDDIDQPIFTVGKRLTRDIYVETTYHHNAPDDENTAEARVKYDFARRWFLEGFFGDAAVGGVGVYWTRSFPMRDKGKGESKPEPK
ncbi:translocation/assembly module TamB domain-containing protein [Pseudenhygromyxa sp. WMMC2535]|uniref:translocation/assembly module TamB domain-containing protein n=1 Tax=Pseudenhygromyxa sp. WMMC2535 TaxID=2712867 RepID=UPI00155394D1|nr:translocation/assembly module TamB [Pseudenhygromyxa sp. WMMC2535]NVB43229.1 translocation/assembly module TamB domain-containing protein [Pseudenhygromyxa sp. WMMC2535]